MAAKRTTLSIVVSVMALVVVLGALTPTVPATGQEMTALDAEPAANVQPEYNVTFNSTTIDELVLRNVVVTDVSVGAVTVDEMTVGEDTSTDVELENVTLERLEIERAVVENVRTGQLSVRNRSVLNVPGGELIGNAGDRSLERHVIDNLTVAGVDIGELHLANLVIEADLQTIEGEVDDPPEEGPTEEPAVSIGDSEAETGTVTNASFERGAVENASVEDETVTPEADGADDGDGDEENGDDESEAVSNDESESVASEVRISARIGR